MSESNGSYDSDMTDSDVDSEDSYDSFPDDQPAPVTTAPALPQLRLNSQDGNIPPTPRGGGVFFNRLSLGPQQPAVPPLSMKILPTAAVSQPLPSARIQPHQPQKAPAQAGEAAQPFGKRIPTLKPVPPVTLDSSAHQRLQHVEAAKRPDVVPRVHLDLLAEGLQLSAAQLSSLSRNKQGRSSAATAAGLKQEAAYSFGVEASHVKLYELVEVAGDKPLRRQCSHFALSIPGAGFSVRAMEKTMENCSDLLHENTRLKVKAESDSQQINVLQEEVLQHSRLIAEQHGKENQGLEALKALRRDNEALRQSGIEMRTHVANEVLPQAAFPESGSQPHGLQHQLMSTSGKSRLDRDGPTLKLHAENHALRTELQELRGKLARSWVVMEEARGVLGDLRREVDLLGSYRDQDQQHHFMSSLEAEQDKQLYEHADDLPRQLDKSSGLHTAFVSCIARLCRENDAANLEKVLAVLNAVGASPS